MATILIVIALALAGFVLSRTRVVRELNSRRFMSVVYAAAAAYFGVRAYGAVSGHTRVWPHAILGAMALAGAIDSARASRLFKRS